MELAFAQGNQADCTALLEMAEEGIITLALPAWSLGEPYETWVRRSRRRNEVYRVLSSQIDEISRSAPYREAANELRPRMTDLLLQSGEEEKRRLDTALERILDCAQIIALNGNTLRSSLDVQNTRSLSPQDSMVYASILQHLREADVPTSCFISTDKDFLNPDIVAELATLNCKGLTKFSDGLGYTRSRL